MNPCLGSPRVTSDDFTSRLLLRFFYCEVAFKKKDNTNEQNQKYRPNIVQIFILLLLFFGQGTTLPKWAVMGKILKYTIKKKKKGKLHFLPKCFGVHRYTLSLTQTHIIVKIYRSSCCRTDFYNN